MKASLVWSAPKPELTIAIAMRRCYSTKPIEEIEQELEQKGPEYWKYLLTRAMQDKSLDVIEHFTMTMALEEMPEEEARWLTGAFPFVRLTRLGERSWLLSMNARTLIEMWRDGEARRFAAILVAELDAKKICPILSPLAFGGGTPAG
jgi:Thymidylate synthase complementing protein